MGLDCGTMGYKKIFDAEVAAGSATCGAVTVKTLNWCRYRIDNYIKAETGY